MATIGGRSKARVRLVGFEARDFKAGKTDDGTTFDAGVSVRICVVDPDDLAVFEVFKARREDVPELLKVKETLTFGVMVDMEYDAKAGYEGQPRRVFCIRPVTTVK